MEAIDDGALTLRDRRPAAQILFHGHCHQKALAGDGLDRRAAAAHPGREVVELDAGCCGMAGSFGFETEHYELSMRIGGMRLFPAVRQEPADDADRRHRRLVPPADRARDGARGAPPGPARARRAGALTRGVGR